MTETIMDKVRNSKRTDQTDHIQRQASIASCTKDILHSNSLKQLYKVNKGTNDHNLYPDILIPGAKKHFSRLDGMWPFLNLFH